MHSIVKNFPSLFFIIPDTVKAYDRVHVKMIQRANGIDILSWDYVQTQNLIFQHLQWYNAPFTFHTIHQNNLYTPQSTLAMTTAVKATLAWMLYPEPNLLRLDLLCMNSYVLKLLFQTH